MRNFKIYPRMGMKTVKLIANFGFSEYQNFGLFLIRVCIGIVFMLHGYPKMFGGIIKWAELGATGMSSIGVDFILPFWGFMAAFSKFIGGICLVLGLFFRPAALLIFITMVFAALFHITSGKGSPASAIQLGVIVSALFISGPGKYSLDHLFFSKLS